MLRDEKMSRVNLKVTLILTVSVMWLVTLTGFVPILFFHNTQEQAMQFFCNFYTKLESKAEYIGDIIDIYLLT